MDRHRVSAHHAGYGFDRVHLPGKQQGRSTSTMTLYDRLGGEAAVAALIDELYVRATGDPLFTPFFEKIDMRRLKAHQFAFTSQALGGPHPYSWPSLVQAHAGLRIEQ